MNRHDREMIDSKCDDLWNTIFHDLDSEYGGDIAGRMAQAAVNGFRAAMEREFETDQGARILPNGMTVRAFILESVQINQRGLKWGVDYFPHREHGADGPCQCNTTGARC